MNCFKSKLNISLIFYITFLFLFPEMSKSDLGDVFKRQQNLSSKCNFQNSNFIGVDRSGSIDDSRFCFDGKMFISYSNLFPNGTNGGTLNKPFRGVNFGDRNIIYEYKLEDGFLWIYQCSSDRESVLNLKCGGPVTRTLRAATDYKAYRYAGERLIWGKGDIFNGTNHMIESINKNPLENISQRKFQAITYSQAAFAYMDDGNYKKAIDFSNKAILLSKDTYVQARNAAIIGLSQHSINGDNNFFCKQLRKAAKLSNFESSKGWFVERESYEKSCS